MTIDDLAEMVVRLQTVINKHVESCLDGVERTREINELKAVNRANKAQAFDELKMRIERLEELNAALCMCYAQSAPGPNPYNTDENAKWAAELLLKIAAETLEHSTID